MTWAQRLKRVFKREIETCETCGGKMKVIASIEDPAVIKRMLWWRGPPAHSERIILISPNVCRGLFD